MAQISLIPRPRPAFRHLQYFLFAHRESLGTRLGSNVRDRFSSNVHIVLLHTPLCTQQLAAAAVKQCIDSIVTTAEEALLQIEDDPYALMQSPVTSMDQFRPCLGRQDSEIIRIQEDMERTGKLLTKIQLEWM